MSNSVGGKFNAAKQDFQVFVITGKGLEGYSYRVHEKEKLMWK